MALPPLYQVLIGLRYLATGGHYKLVGDSIKVCKSTVCKCAHDISRLMAAKSKDFIHFPSQTALVNVKVAFQNIAGIPNICGCVDGCFVRIR